jgi:ATP-binding protein involved in chromosome partitioning
MSDSFEISSRTIAEGDPIPDVKNVILVMSGKGGVGKSTVAANLVMALQTRGARVGLLDADIYGPSAPTMFGINERPQSNGNKILPLEQYGIKLMSIGFLLEDQRSAVVWRGPMLHSALMQFLGDVAWGKLDFLVLDLPPGTGDVALTLAQNLQANGAVLVTTPQEVAVQDVYKAVSMNQKVGIPTLGVVENQSYFICEHGSRYEIFGKGGGAKVAQMAEAPLLGQIPIDLAIRECGDEGKPVVGAKPESASARAFLAVADALIERVRAENTSQDGDLTIDRSGGVNRHLPIAR